MSPAPEKPLTVRELLTRTTEYLGGKGIPKPRVDAEWLLAEALDTDRLGLYLEHDRLPSDDQIGRLREMVRRRGGREPLQYILGWVQFHKINLDIGPGALCPRPETEVLVECALKRIEGVENPVVVDVGTGGGPIACAIAAARNDATVHATDVSPEALEWARRNVRNLKLTERVHLYEGDLAAPLKDVLAPGTCDLFTSNPPYVSTLARGELQPEVNEYEPPVALYSPGPRGTEIYPRLIAQAAELLKPGGAMVLEIAAGRHEDIREMIGASGLFGEIVFTPDLAGILRVAEASRTTA